MESLVGGEGSLKDLSVPYTRPHARPIPQFLAHGDSKCLPKVSQELVEHSAFKHATCRKYSPFITGRARIATATAHFGEPNPHYQKALENHLLHSLIHGTEVRVMCDPIVDSLWNKPAFILELLLREMLKPEKERLEWIQWVDRDTLILDHCRPISSFLPPEQSRFGTWWHPSSNDQNQPDKPDNTTHLLVTSDVNGLNNGVFLLRVNHWAIDLFTAILAFRHYKPDVELRFTEQSAMEHVLRTDHFKHQIRFVPQSWFNAYDRGGAELFATRENEEGLQADHVRRGDYLVHFAGHGNKGQVIEEWVGVLGNMEDVWEKGSVQRDVSREVAEFWRGLGYGT
ncbi:glycosyltransferase family 34 protein [Cucurbitaria berberidis CBS 394.84]|uniref:Glycosyltransferase family 34 protein n=1 Tax=Cucurbitaria berberidis CBS 394.84 TaxID=1168544 RepID=A0A9P4L3Q1_9PLEO|nr:glycosyltransferase family 34 protein [Cucurbitaria berberidis CBS 394.84]KAF1840008.1 glycosyltransferase family 34 protein [Cucurbitaria berberidis CBS 394.84]